MAFWKEPYRHTSTEILNGLHRDIKSKYPTRLNVSEFSTTKGRRIDMLSLNYMGGNIKGYEIKTSRSDFTSDKKWKDYLPYCHQFYFVCPPGIIKLEDLPKEVGLIYAEVGYLYEHYETGEPIATREHCIRFELIRGAKQHGEIGDKMYDYIMKRLAFRILDLHKMIKPARYAWREGFEFEYGEGILDIHGNSVK